MKDRIHPTRRRVLQGLAGATALTALPRFAYAADPVRIGLILPMTEQLLEQVITDLPQLAPEQWVSVNLVAAHIEQPLLRTLLAHSQNPSPTRLTFELTERKPILDIKAATEEITLLQQFARRGDDHQQHASTTDVRPEAHPRRGRPQCRETIA